MSRELKLRLLPWGLFVIGFLLLNRFGGIISGACIVVGIMMLIERRWPEKWGNEVQ